MNKKDRVAFVVSSIVVLLSLFILAEEGPEGLLLLPPVGLYWLYKYLNNDISFIARHNGSGES
ncbi:hypothetical protein Q6D67_04750 [Haliea sp. E1-2-M8]|uniref:hypothetical protein n=1 Tax=Haliea sp. E1-2-M8 TaxID=3064706 RepID=UPI00271A7A7E|nr:hypothetical protein [Haliea sp. E1-2-M8]MDO8861004.1 hypothetical protein [Haliea sp. E1-2-M8]